MGTKIIELKEKNRINYDVLDSNEIKFLERDKLIMEMVKKKPNKFKKKLLLSKESISPNSNDSIDISTYSLVGNRFDATFPADYKHVPEQEGGALYYPISSSRADNMGNFHLGLGIGSYVSDYFQGPNFGNGNPTNFNRHSVSAKICHSFQIDSFLEEERNYTVKSKITVPLGGIQFDINNFDLDRTINWLSKTYFAGYLIGNLKMKLFVNDNYLKTVKKTFLQKYKNAYEDLGFEIDFLNELKTDLNIKNDSILKVEIEVEIIAANTMHMPNGGTPNIPGVYIGVQYFNPEFVLREEYKNVRYLFDELGETSDLAASIKLDYIELLDTELNTIINPIYVNDEMQSV